MNRKIEIDVNQVEALAAQGMTEGEIADALGISSKTLYRRKEEMSELSEALKKGKAKGIAVATNKLFEAVKEGKAWAICFFLKCRAGWSEKVQIDNTSSDGSMTPREGVDLSRFTPEQLMAIRGSYDASQADKVTPYAKIEIGKMTPEEQHNFLDMLYAYDKKDAETDGAD